MKSISYFKRLLHDSAVTPLEKTLKLICCSKRATQPQSRFFLVCLRFVQGLTYGPSYGWNNLKNRQGLGHLYFSFCISGTISNACEEVKYDVTKPMMFLKQSKIEFT